nr:PREDICTED: uncharacterized protein LOC108198229 [Daucus carota subsp. sativus]
MSYPLILVVIAVKTKGSDLDNRFVVPYNRDLLLLFQCHINVEICNNSRSLKYLFKYCLKGHDNATMLLKKNNGSRVNIQQVQAGKPLDEVALGRQVTYTHARNKYVSFRTGESLQQVCNRADTKRSKLEGWFIANKEITAARNYTYNWNHRKLKDWHVLW